jgi:hypothetical protein
MAVGSGGGRVVSRTGRAVCDRRGDALTAMPNALGEAGPAGATILIAGPGSWSAPETEIAMLARRGFQVVVSPAFTVIARNNLLNTGILPVCLSPETITKVQDTVGSDPGIVLTVDVSRGELLARGQLIAQFEIDQEPAPGETTGAPDRRGYGGETMALRLLMAQRLLGSACLPGDVRIRLQRRLVAICDAMKAPGADEVRGARRLDRLLTDLARTGQDGPAPAAGRRSATPDGTAAARGPGPREGTSRARRRP